MLSSPDRPRAGQSGLWQDWACGSIGDPSGGTVWRPCPEGCSVGPRFSRGYPFVAVPWGATLAAGQLVYSTTPEGRCWVVKTGYVKLLDPRVECNRFIRLILGRGG